MIRYAITDGARFGADAVARRDALLKDATRWASAGVEYVQVREKDLRDAELLFVVREMKAVFREQGGATKLLVNGRLHVAVDADADGVHLVSGADKAMVKQARESFDRAIVVSVSCHSLGDVRRARGADLILFGPVYEKRVNDAVVTEGVGVEALREACVMAGEAKVLALGGVDASNVQECVDAGAAGVAAIRMFAR